MRGDALQTFKNISSPNRENVADVLTVFRWKNVKPQSITKHNFQRLLINPAKQKLIDFLDELQGLGKDAFGVAALAIIEQFVYAKMPRHLKKSNNQDHLENGTCEQIVSHPERELESSFAVYEKYILFRTNSKYTLIARKQTLFANSIEHLW